VRLVVTTPLHPRPAEAAAAREAAARHALPLVPRDDGSLERLVAAAGADAALVLSRAASTLWCQGEGRRWAPGMGLLRMKRALARLAGDPVPPSDRDPFLEAATIGPGDAVLDATLGLGADALVAAAACGPDGRVVAVEGSAALAAWVAEGLRRLAAEPARRIEVRTGDHLAVLAGLPGRSFDVVVFDPMFRHARAEPGGFDLVRRLADPRGLSAEALAEARRVARRWVVVKDGAPGWDLARLGLAPLPSARGAHRYYARLEPAATPG
jgi:16S rRNA (guanine1516-N2)-methyltransferase